MFDFSLIKTSWEELYKLLAASSHYLIHDPNASMIKSRIATELIVEKLLTCMGKDTAGKSLAERILILKDNNVENEMISLLDFSRIIGNKAVHENHSSKKDALKSLAGIHRVSLWVIKNYYINDGISKQSEQEKYKASLKKNKTNLLNNMRDVNEDPAFNDMIDSIILKGIDIVETEKEMPNVIVNKNSKQKENEHTNFTIQLNKDKTDLLNNKRDLDENSASEDMIESIILNGIDIAESEEKVPNVKVNHESEHTKFKISLNKNTTNLFNNIQDVDEDPAFKDMIDSFIQNGLDIVESVEEMPDVIVHKNSKKNETKTYNQLMKEQAERITKRYF